MHSFAQAGQSLNLGYTKNGMKRYVPLNETIRQLLGNLQRNDEYVFHETRGERLLSIRKPLTTAIGAQHQKGVERLDGILRSHLFATSDNIVKMVEV